MASGSAAPKNLVSMTDESELKKKILETHAHDGSKLDTKLLLAAAEGIFNNLLTSGVDDTLNISVGDDVEKRTGAPTLPIPPWLVCKVLKLIFEMVGKAFNCSTRDNKETAMDMLQLLSAYDWETKITTVLAAYVINYAEFSLVTQLYANNEIAKSIAILKQIPENYDDIIPVGTKRKCNELVKASFEVAKLIAEISSLPSKYISDDVEPKAAALSDIPATVYWMTTAAVACASTVTGTPQLSEGTETWDHLSLLEEKIISKRTFFKTQLHLCNNHIAQNNPCCE